MGSIYILGSSPHLPTQVLNLFPSSHFAKTQYRDISTFSQEVSALSNKQVHDWRTSLSAFQLDILYLETPPQKNKKTLFVFDMDSTLIKQEVIDELARRAGVFGEVSRITEEAMQGNLDFETSLRRRCSLLRGISEEIFNELYPFLELNQGVMEFFEDSFFQASKKVVLSGGFSPILKSFTRDYKFSDYRANTLVVRDGLLTGELDGEIIDSRKKKEYLHYFSELYEIEQVFAIGDGANDTGMINSTPFGFGFKPKEGLKRGITNWIEYTPLYGILSIFD